MEQKLREYIDSLFEGAVPTKIKGLRGNLALLKVLADNARGKYNP